MYIRKRINLKDNVTEMEKEIKTEFIIKQENRRLYVIECYQGKN